ncbi:uncharacterized protein VP01_7258g1, partial [Puccinia sorghi]
PNPSLVLWITRSGPAPFGSQTQALATNYKAFFSPVNFFSQMTPLCSQMIARRYSASYSGDRASKWFKPYLDLLENQSPSCLINNWDRFGQQLFSLFRDPNEDNGKALNYIALFQTLQSRIDWNNAAFAFHFRKGLP